MVDRAIDHPLMPKRRWFLKTALAIGAVGATLGGLVFWHRGLRDGKLTVHGRDVCHGLARGILGPMLPQDPTLRAQVLEAHLDNLEKAVVEGGFELFGKQRLVFHDEYPQTFRG